MQISLKKKITIGLLLLLLIVLYIASPLFPIAYSHLIHWWELYQNREPSAKEMLKYYENLPQPTLTSAALVEKMKEQKGLLRENEQLVRTAEYYAYHGRKDVIKQLIANLLYEVELRLPEERERGTSINGRDIIGKSYSILKNRWGLMKDISPVLHEELHRYAEINSNPHLIYLIMELIGSNDPLIQRPDNDPNYFAGGGVYYDIDCYTEELVCKDVLAYLRIYSKYNDWPTIRDYVVGSLQHYPGDWLDRATNRNILSIADEKGIDAAYARFLEWFNTGRIDRLNKIRSFRDQYN